jgi:ACS family glucarate transporter-like MFS transporter
MKMGSQSRYNSASMQAPGAIRPPSWTRWKILALLTLISAITYVDRVNISVAARQMMPALGFDQLQMGYVFSAFVLGYALFQIPGGWLGDRWGPRKVLAAALLWWSFFTACTAIAGTLPSAAWFGVLGSFILVRFLIGVGEAAALPNFNRTVANWFPPSERGFGMGVSIGGIGIGASVTPPVVAWIMVNYGWQSAFYASALAGILIALIWVWYARDLPEQHTCVSDAELQYIRSSSLTHGSALQNEAGILLSPHRRTEQGKREAVPWAAFLRTPPIWWLVLAYTCLGYVAYVYMTWFYLYLVNERGFDILRGAFFAMGPFIAMALFCPFGGWLTDRLAVSLGLNRGRSYVGCGGMLVSGLCILAGARVAEPYLAILLLSLGAGFLYFTVGAFWASTIDLTSRHAGTLSGVMNTGANIGGTISPTLTPWLAEQYGWQASLGFTAFVAVLGGMLWLLIRPEEGLRKKQEGPLL